MSYSFPPLRGRISPARPVTLGHLPSLLRLLSPALQLKEVEKQVSYSQQPQPQSKSQSLIPIATYAAASWVACRYGVRQGRLISLRTGYSNSWPSPNSSPSAKSQFPNSTLPQRTSLDRKEVSPSEVRGKPPPRRRPVPPPPLLNSRRPAAPLHCVPPGPGRGGAPGPAWPTTLPERRCGAGFPAPGLPGL